MLYVLLWNIWLMRNKITFQDQKSCMRKVQSKTRSLIVEAILAKNNSYFNANEMHVEEIQIFRCVLDHLPNYQRPPARQPNYNEQWKVRLKEKEFLEWLDGIH